MYTNITPINSVESINYIQTTKYLLEVSSLNLEELWFSPLAQTYRSQIFAVNSCGAGSSIKFHFCSETEVAGFRDGRVLLTESRRVNVAGEHDHRL
jgi:hypothetical protein